MVVSRENASLCRACLAGIAGYIYEKTGLPIVLIDQLNQVGERPNIEGSFSLIDNFLKDLEAELPNESELAPKEDSQHGK